MFYDGSANLVKTWLVPCYANVSDWEDWHSVGALDYLRTDIIRVDDAHVFVVCSYSVYKDFGFYSTSMANYVDVYYLNVNTLSYAEGNFFDEMTGGYTTSSYQATDQVLFGYEDCFYAVVSSPINNEYLGTNTYLLNLTDYSNLDVAGGEGCYSNPTINENFDVLEQEDYLLWGSSYCFVDTDNVFGDMIFVFCGNGSGSDHLLWLSVGLSLDDFEMDCHDFTIQDDSFSDRFMFYGGYLVQNISNVMVFDVLCGFGYTDQGDEVLKVELVRYESDNGTFSVVASSASELVTVGGMRCFGVGSVSMVDDYELLDGAYAAVYADGSGVMKRFEFLLSDLDTFAPQLDADGLSNYQGLVYPFTGDHERGGLVDCFDTVILYVDFSTGSCRADLVTPFGATVAYSLDWNPNEVSVNGLIYQLAPSTSYVLTLEMTLNSVGADATVTVSRRAYGSEEAFVYRNTGYLVDGSGDFSYVTDGVAVAWEYRFYVAFDDFSGSYVLDMVWMNTNAAGASPTPYNGGSGGSGFGGGLLDDAVSLFFVSLLYIFVPPLLVVVAVPKVGMAGFMCVLAGTVALGVFYLRLPFYFLIFAGIGIAVMFYGVLKRGT